MPNETYIPNETYRTYPTKQTENDFQVTLPLCPSVPVPVFSCLRLRLRLKSKSLCPCPCFPVPVSLSLCPCPCIFMSASTSTPPSQVEVPVSLSLCPCPCVPHELTGLLRWELPHVVPLCSLPCSPLFLSCSRFWATPLWIPPSLTATQIERKRDAGAHGGFDSHHSQQRALEWGWSATAKMGWMERQSHSETTSNILKLPCLAIRVQKR